MNLRKEARGRECQVRLPGVCNGNPETTVLAHYRLVGISGTGLKPPDLIGAWACSACHDVVDGRVPSMMEQDRVKRYFAEGVFRTQYALIREGKL